MKNIVNKYQTEIIFIILTFISCVSFYHFFVNGQHLLYGDSLSRMNISRKVIDNLTPGFAQLGNVWLPLPQVLMLPLIWNGFLWHSGMAGAVMSMAGYIVGGLYIYKSTKILTNSFLSAFISSSIYFLNINLLYLQTTAMSESLFLLTLSALIYYFLKWINTNKSLYLIYSGIAVSSATLIRYEGLAILFTSILIVFVYTCINAKDYKKAEGKTILYATLACLGFVFWSLYLMVIFGDPLYWLHYYTASPVDLTGQSFSSQVSHLSFLGAVGKYFTAVVWMNGLIPTLLAIISLPVLVQKNLKNNSYYFLSVLIPISIYAFMIFTLQKNTPIDQPSLSFANILSPATSEISEFNIRYGILMLPLIALLFSYLFNLRYKVLKVILTLLLCIQFLSYFRPQYSVIYQFPISIKNNNTQGTPRDKAMIKWLKENYDKGLIMISALKHDPQMFQLGVNYKSYIHEGAGKYWIESTKNPQRYASWLVFDSLNKDDQVTKFLLNAPVLDLYYDLKYDRDGMKIYKIKTKPEIEV